MSKSGKKTNYVQRRRYASRLQHERQQYETHLVSLDRIADALERASGQEQAEDNKRARREVTTIVLLIFTVIFTGLADIIFFYTMKEAREAVAIQHTDSDLALGEAKESAAKLLAGSEAATIEARRQADTTSDTEKRQLRAYVVIDPGTFSLSQDGIPTEVNYLPNNVGQTPAHRAQFFGRASLVGERLEAWNLLSQKFNIDAINHGSVVIKPSSQFKDTSWATAKVNPVITSDVWNNARQRITSYIVLYGEIIYLDVFDEEHHTWYCYMDGGMAINGITQLTSGQWQPCLTPPNGLDPNRFD